MEIHENVLSSNNACIKNQLGIMWFKCAMLFIHFFHKRNDKYYYPQKLVPDCNYLR